MSRRQKILALSVAALACLGAGGTRAYSFGLVWNATASAPLGLYLLTPDSHPQRGDLVYAMPPFPIRRFAAARGYLPSTVPLIKRIAALSPDTICSTKRTIAINGRAIAQRLAADWQGRSLPHWTGCRKLRRDEMFLLMAGVHASFDSRYFGAISTTAIIGKLAPLWTH